MNIKKTTITPELAKKFLDKNPKNRNLSSRLVQKIKKQIVDGSWMEDTGESIKFDVHGDLIDGQHRLEAIYRSGIAVKTLLVTGLPDGAINFIDTGKARTSSDLLSMNNVKYSTLVNAIIIAKFNLISEHQNPSNKKILDVYNSNSSEIDYCASTAYKLSTKGKSVIRKSDIGIALYVLREIDTEDADKFVRMVSTGIAIESETSPAFALRNFLINDYSSTNPVPLRTRRRTWIKCWNKYRAGESIKKLNIQTKPIKPI